MSQDSSSPVQSASSVSAPVVDPQTSSASNVLTSASAPMTALASTAPPAAGGGTLDTVREELKALQKQFKQTLWIGSLAVAGLSAIGIGKLSDIEAKARERVDAAVNKGTEYFDVMANAQARLNAGNWSGAIANLEQAVTLRPDDELIFYQLAGAYATSAEIQAGLKLIEDAERAGLLLRKYSSVWSHLNVARIYMLAASSEEKYKALAQSYFDKAERAASRSKGGEIAYVLYSRGVHELMYGQDARADGTFREIAEIDPRAEKWPEGDRPDPWFQLALKVRPTLQADMESRLSAK